MNNQKTTIKWYLWRFTPIHLWHEDIINNAIQTLSENIDNPYENFFIWLGSINRSQSMKYFFNEEERIKFIKMLYPNIKILWIPDVRDRASEEENNKIRLNNLDNIINNEFPDTNKEIIFYWGSYEDVEFFEKDNRKIQYMNRYDGTTTKVSATEVRDALIQIILSESNNTIREQRLYDKNIVNKIIAPDLLNLFEHKWNEFKKK